MVAWLKPKDEVKKRTGIYSIRNIENRRLYIGRTVDIKRRWMEHINKLEKGSHNNKELQADYIEYGSSCFELDVVEFTDDINYRELYYIDFYKLWESEPLYNVPTAKDNITYEVAHWSKNKGYSFEIDGADNDCLGLKGRPLKWNLIIDGLRQEKKIFINLVSPQMKADEDYFEETKKLRCEFIRRHNHFKQISMDYSFDNAFNVEEVVFFIQREIEKWFK